MENIVSFTHKVADKSVGVIMLCTMSPCILVKYCLLVLATGIVSKATNFLHNGEKMELTQLVQQFILSKYVLNVC